MTAPLVTHVLNEYGTTICPVECVRANVDDGECSACGGPVQPREGRTTPLVTPSRDALAEALKARGWLDSADAHDAADDLLASGVVRAVDTLADAIKALPTTRTKAWDRGWDSVSLEDVLRALATALDPR